jgi:hypothetical protein
MTEHTPGPWYISGGVHPVGNAEDGIHDLYCADVIPPHDERWRGYVCTIQSADHISGISKEEAEANARLIRAAPDLLAACRRFAEEWRNGHVSVGACEDAEAAIALARGEG